MRTPKVKEISISEVVELTGVSRRTLMRYCSLFDKFIPRHNRRPLKVDTSKGGLRRILYFEAGALENINLIKELSRQRIPEHKIRFKLKRERKGYSAEVLALGKILPLLLVLKERSNSVQEIDNLSDDFLFAPLAGAIEVVERSLSIELPVSMRVVGVAKYDDLLFLVNLIFLYHLREGLSGNKLKLKLEDYLSESIRIAGEVKKLRDYLVGAIGVGGRWSKKEEKRIRFFVYEIVEVLGWSAGEAIELITACRLKIIIPIPSAGDIQIYWWELLDSILHCKKELRKFGVSNELVKCIIKVRMQLHNLK